MFYALAKTHDLCDGFRASRQLPGLSVLLFVVGGQVYIVENRCPHLDVPLETASIQEGTLRCIAHGIGFDLPSGAAQGIWADLLPCLRFFEPVYQGYDVGITWRDLAQED
jgi:nitrite reductase/ring-hydroxylating ferredoxin subunit